MIAALIPQLLPILGSAIDKVIPDNVSKEVAKKELEKALVDNANSINLESIKTNQIEAGHRSVWVSGWRPAIGWSCSLGIAWLFIGHPLATWAAMLSGCPIKSHAIPRLHDQPIAGLQPDTHTERCPASI